MSNSSKKQNNKQLIEAVDHFFTTVSPGELSDSMDHFMGSAIKDDTNHHVLLSGMWYHYDELRDFLHQMITIYKKRVFTD